jgi:hypothetical protein
VSDSEGTFWLGLVLAFPIGIAATLAAPAVLRLFAHLNGSAAEKLVSQRMTEEAEARSLAEDPAQFHGFLLVLVLRTTYVAAVFGALAGSTALAAQGVDAGAGSLGRHATGTLHALSQILALVGAVAVVRLARRGLLMSHMVRRLRAAPPPNEDVGPASTSARERGRGPQTVRKTSDRNQH